MVSETKPLDPHHGVPGDLPPDATHSYNPARTVVYRLAESKESQEELDGELVPIIQSLLNETKQLSQWSVAVQEDSKSPLPLGHDTASYILRKRLGRGGFGEVWESLQSSLGRLVAVKRLRADLLRLSQIEGEKQASNLANSFRHEAYTAAALDHPNIVPVYDLGIDELGHPLLAMKLVKGRPWNAVLDRDITKLDYDEFLEKHVPILAEVSQAVAFAHSRGIVHRDLKPSQVMTGDFGEVLLMDWGLALWLDGDGDTITKVSYRSEFTPATRNVASNPAGTVAYMAPEQTERTAENIGVWTDVYLLGAILYEILTGKTPHDGGNPTATFSQAKDGYVIPLAKAAPGRAVPPELADICMKALQPARADRHATVNEFMQALKDYLSGASRRRESIEFTDQAAHLLLEAGTNYQKLTDTLGLLTRAETLWQHNPKMAPLRLKTLSQHADAALKNGDLALARVQAERIEEENEREKVLVEVKVGERTAKRNHFVRKTAIIAALLSLTVGLVAAGILNYQAESAKNDAVGTMRYMLKDVFPRLNELGSVDLMESVAKQALAYQYRHPEEGDLEAMNVSSGAHRAMGRVCLRKGDMMEATRHLTESLRLRREILARKESAATLSILSDVLLDISNIHQQADDMKSYVNAIKEALEVGQKALKLEPDSIDALRSCQVAARRLAELYQQAQVTEKAQDSANLALDYSKKAYALSPESVQEREGMALSWRVMADLRMQEQKPDEATRLLQDAGKEYEAILSSGAWKRAYREALDDINFQLGTIAWDELRAQDVIGFLDKADPLDIRNLEPSADWQKTYSLAVLFGIKAEAYEELGNLQGALEYSQHANHVFGKLIESNPENPDLYGALAWSLFVRGRVCRSTRQETEAMECFEKARATFESLKKMGGEADYLYVYAFTLLYLGDFETARPVVAKLVEEDFRYHRWEEALALAGWKVSDFKQARQ